MTESWGHPSSFPLRGRWERPIPSRKWAPSSPLTGRCGSCGARPTPYLVQVECPNAGAWEKSDGTYYQALNFQKWSASETEAAEPHRFGNSRPELNPRAFSSAGVLLRNYAQFASCPLIVSAP